MKDNRDPKVMGEFLLSVRTQPNYVHLGLADVARTAFDGIVIKDYGETDEEYAGRIASGRPPISPFALQNGRTARS